VKAYRFRLATVARIRALEERLARERYVFALRDLRHAREAERSALVALAALEPPVSPATMVDVLWIGDQAERLSQSVQTCRQVVAAVTSMSVEAGRSWNLAVKRSGVLERLDDQGLVRWRDEALRQEVSELDDFANARHGSAAAS
jgi:hypothetical protein